MHESIFKIQSFAIFGIYHTWHGAALIRHVLAAGLRPKFALISAATEDQLAKSKKYWTHPEWWREVKAVSRLAKIFKRSKTDGTVEYLYRSAGIPYLFVPGFASDVTYGLLEQGAADAMLLAEGPILKGRIFNLFPKGIINLHAAPLPAYRGNRAAHWALYHDEPLCVSAHLVDEGVDSGSLLGQRPLPVDPGDALENIDRRGLETCGQLAAEILRQALAEGVPVTPQAPWQGRTFKGKMPQDIYEELVLRLKKREYTHYA